MAAARKAKTERRRAGAKERRKSKGSAVPQSLCPSVSPSLVPPSDLSSEDLSYISQDLRVLARPILLPGPDGTPVQEFAFDPKNANDHGEESIDGICASLAEFGQRKPVVANLRTMRFEAGEGTVRAAIRLGWTHIAVVRVNDDESTATGFAIADNRAAELSTWNQQRLAELLPQVQEDFSDLFDELLMSELDRGSSPEPETKEVPVTQKFGLYLELASETEQKGLYERLKREGFSVRVLTI